MIAARHCSSSTPAVVAARSNSNSPPAAIAARRRTAGDTVEAMRRGDRGVVTFRPSEFFPHELAPGPLPALEGARRRSCDYSVIPDATQCRSGGGHYSLYRLARVKRAERTKAFVAA